MIIKVIDLLEPDWDYECQGDRINVSKKKIGRGWHHYSSFLLPQEIEVDEQVAECIGMYLGDGKLTANDMCHLDYTSKDMDLAQKMLTFFIRLGIKPENMTFTVSYRDGEIKNITDIIVSHIGHQKFRIAKTNRNKYPAIHMQVNGKIMRTIFIKAIFISLPFIQTETRLRKAYLRGYFSAEGWIGYSRAEHYIANVGFAYNPQKETWLRDYCMKCLNLEGICSNINIVHNPRCGQIVLSNWKNYYRMWKIGIFDGCERKRKKFLKIFSGIKITCQIEKELLQRLFSGNQHELAKLLGTYQATISNMKAGSKRNMWPTVQQVIILSNLNRIPLEDIKRNINQVRIGSRTALKSTKVLIEDIFTRENLGF